MRRENTSSTTEFGQFLIVGTAEALERDGSLLKPLAGRPELGYTVLGLGARVPYLPAQSLEALCRCTDTGTGRILVGRRLPATWFRPPPGISNLLADLPQLLAELQHALFSLVSSPLAGPHLGLGLRAGLLKLLDGLLLGLIAFSLERRQGDEVCFFRRCSGLRLLRRFILDQSFPGRRVLFRGLLVRDLVIAHPNVPDVIAHTSNVSPWPSQRNRSGA
ncbi:hypothetical protein AB0H37_43935 [Actinomadura sp. NPDC023710]|uniref:hypothetical protein n=1 Tax=Actinomadura sp. NPDC023710 TaxID=3158219 RepID=UPI0033C848E8